MIKLFLKRWKLKRQLKDWRRMQSLAWCHKCFRASKTYGRWAEEAEKELKETYDR